MTWSAPDRDLAAIIERRLRSSLVEEPGLHRSQGGDDVVIDTLRIEMPESATLEQIGERVTIGVADRLRERDRR